jgi:peptidoglycan/LPS O-acetylase OafA/YrhL
MPTNIEPDFMHLQQLALLIILCVLSLNLVEKPINNLKRRYKSSESGAREELKCGERIK